MRSNAGMLYITMVALGLFSLGAAGQGWFTVIQPHTSSTILRAASILHPAIFTLLLLLLIPGSFVIRLARPNGIRAFAFVMFTHLLISIGGGIFVIIIAFKQPPLPAECHDPIKFETDPTCQQGRGLMPNESLVSLYALTWLIEGYLAWHAYNYQKVLRDSDMVSDLVAKAAAAAGPLPGTMFEPKVAYPFAQPTASHGSTPGRMA